MRTDTSHDVKRSWWQRLTRRVPHCSRCGRQVACAQTRCYAWMET